MSLVNKKLPLTNKDYSKASHDFLPRKHSLMIVSFDYWWSSFVARQTRARVCSVHMCRLSLCEIFVIWPVRLVVFVWRDNRRRDDNRQRDDDRRRGWGIAVRQAYFRVTGGLRTNQIFHHFKQNKAKRRNSAWMLWNRKSPYPTDRSRKDAHVADWSDIVENESGGPLVWFSLLKMQRPLKAKPEGIRALVRSRAVSESIEAKAHTWQAVISAFSCKSDICILDMHSITQSASVVVACKLKLWMADFEDEKQRSKPSKASWSSSFLRRLFEICMHDDGVFLSFDAVSANTDARYFGQSTIVILLWSNLPYEGTLIESRLRILWLCPSVVIGGLELRVGEDFLDASRLEVVRKDVAAGAFSCRGVHKVEVDGDCFVWSVRNCDGRSGWCHDLRAAWFLPCAPPSGWGRQPNVIGDLGLHFVAGRLF